MNTWAFSEYKNDKEHSQSHCSGSIRSNTTTIILSSVEDRFSVKYSFHNRLFKIVCFIANSILLTEVQVLPFVKQKVRLSKGIFSISLICGHAIFTAIKVAIHYTGLLSIETLINLSVVANV